MDDLKLNIIYTPGSVRGLSLFVHSALRWMPVRFRLVSNGCDAAERRVLQRLCATDGRLSYWALPYEACVPHGMALDHLLSITRERHFAFMDSDIFLSGDVMPELRQALKSHQAVFGGLPIWVREDEALFPQGFRNMTGMFNRDAEGRVLGSTFFAVYEVDALRRAQEEAGLGFDNHRLDDLPAKVQQRVQALGYDVDYFETGKVLTLMMLDHGAALANLTLPALHHIGGSSFQILMDQTPETLRQRLNRHLPAAAQAVLRRRRMARLRARYRHRYANAPEAELQVNVEQRLLRRDPVRQYFLAVMQALSSHKPAPLPVVTGDSETDGKICNVRSAMIDLFERDLPVHLDIVSE